HFRRDDEHAIAASDTLPCEHIGGARRFDGKALVGPRIELGAAPEADRHAIGVLARACGQELAQCADAHRSVAAGPGHATGSATSLVPGPAFLCARIMYSSAARAWNERRATVMYDCRVCAKPGESASMRFRFARIRSIHASRVFTYESFR